MSVAPILRLFLLSLPGFAVQGIPSGVILAVCLVLNRAVRDNEIIALRVGGASLPRIMAPFLFMALLASIANFLIVERIAPHTNDRANRLRARIVGENAAPFIDSDRYFRAGNYHFYVGTAQNGVLKNVMVYERNSSRIAAFAPNVFPTVYIAQRARENPKNKGEWILEKGVTHVYNPDGSQLSQAIFDSISIPIEQEISGYFGEQKDAFP
jgi:lipopolysaccharide export system permease protein